MMRRLATMLLALLIVAHQAHAQGVATPTEQEALSWLTQGQFDKLDASFGAIQQAYRDRKISDEDLRAAFRVFYSTDAALGKFYTAWVQHSPRSYVAHLARGIYYKKVGAEQRGSDFIDKTSDRQIEYMEAANRMAAAEFSASLALDDKPLLTYMHSIDLDMDSGDKAQARQWLDRSLAFDPTNIIVREKYMLALQTRWLGSVGEMKAFLAECRKAHLSSEHLKLLEALELEDEAWVHQYRDGDLKAAVRSYDKASKLDPASSCAPCGPIRAMADLLMSEKKYAEASKQLSRLLASDPDDVNVLNVRAFAELQLGRPLEAVADYVRAGNLGDMYAQDALGRMYLLGNPVKADRDKAIFWLKKAADQGSGSSQALLALALTDSQRPMPSPGSP